MRLLNTQSLRLEEFPAGFPPYAILSHVWGADEVTFENVRSLSHPDEADRRKAGWRKIRHCCRHASQQGFQYIWVDTCCIDKSSSAELSEAINSMYRWYRDSFVCFAYLADVPNVSNEKSFFGSRWFTRGWTLQELIAPQKLIFLDASWHSSVSRKLMADKIHKFIGVDAAILLGSRSLRGYSVAQRFSWAAHRDTTRLEDRAYSLLGLFNVNMPLLYGEGSKAFLRLQEEVLRVTQDLSILAWSNLTRVPESEEGFSPLAPSPTSFGGCDDIVSAMSLSERYFKSEETIITAHSVRLTTKLVRSPGALPGAPDEVAVVLKCRYRRDVTKVIALRLEPAFSLSDEDLMQGTEILEFRGEDPRNQSDDRIVLVDVCDVAETGVVKTIIVRRTNPEITLLDITGKSHCSHLWLRFDNPLLDKIWITQDVFPQIYWNLENRTFDLNAAFAEVKESGPLRSTIAEACVIHATIVLTDGLRNRIIIYIRMRNQAGWLPEIQFQLGYYDPNSYLPGGRVSGYRSIYGPNSSELQAEPQSIELQDGTFFCARMRERLDTDQRIAHLAITIESQVPEAMRIVRNQTVEFLQIQEGVFALNDLRLPDQ